MNHVIIVSIWTNNEKVYYNVVNSIYLLQCNTKANTKLMSLKNCVTFDPQNSPVRNLRHYSSLKKTDKYVEL